MVTCKWTSQEETLCQSLLATKSHAEISAEIIKRFLAKAKGFPSARSANAVERKCGREGWEAVRALAPTAAAEEQETTWDSIKAIIKKHKDDSVSNTRGVIPRSKIVTKILALSDIHFPLADANHLQSAVSAHPDANVVVVNGDLFEGYMFSTFEKNKVIAALDEYNAAFMFIEWLAQRYPRVILVDGNHDVRVSRALQGVGLSKAATQVLRPNLMARIANGERLDSNGKLVEKLDFKNVTYQENESWYVRVGKTLFIHPHGSGSGGPGGMVRKHAARFNTRYNPGEIDSIVCGHTHQVYKSIINNQLLIEQGCLAGFLKYSWTPKAEFLTNAQNGYAVIYQDAEGNTDFNMSGPIYLGEVLPPKKSVV